MTGSSPTGIRNSSALDWRQGDGLYLINHGRDGTSKGWPEIVSQAEDDAIPDEMFKIVKGTDMGWPYTYWDGVKKVRLSAPEYGGDGKTPEEIRKTFNIKVGCRRALCWQAWAH